MSPLRRGYLYGLAAYVLWGFFPLYFKLLRPATPIEILAHRVVWSMAFVAVVLAATRSWRFVVGIVRRPRTLSGITLAAILVAVNWGTYIYGVNSGHVVETSLGYFINPLVTVLLGVAVLRERLRPWQWLALGIGTAAVAVLAVGYGRLLWIAFTVAVTFGLYGLTKKRLGLPATQGLFVESSVLALPALGYLGWLAAAGKPTFGHVSVAQTSLLVLTGAVTAIPLLLFAGAANRVPLSALGPVQYVGPVLQLGCGVLVFGEPMPPVRLVGFTLVWLALAVFTVDGIRNARRATRGRTQSDSAPDSENAPGGFLRSRTSTPRPGGARW